MTDDLVKRLRSMEVFFMDGCISPVAYAAADRIEKLEAALEKIAQHDMQAVALDALRPNERIREKKDGKKDRG